MNKSERITLPEGVPYLNSFYFYLTHGCNLACRHCWLSPEFQKNDGSTGGHLDFELLKQAINEGIPLGLNAAKLTGGEPLLHPDFVKIVDFLSEKELNVTIETNGTLLTREIAFYLKEHSTVWHVSVSIDGANAETHNRFRGVTGAFQKACNAVHNLAEAGFKPQIIMSIHHGNVDQIENLVSLAGELDAGSVKFNLIQPTGRGELMKKRKETLTIKDLIKIGNWVENDLQKDVTFPLYYSWPPAFHNLHNLLKQGSSSCGVFGILGILSDGLYAMCGIGVQIPELVYGKIGVDNLQEVWTNNPMLNKLRRVLPADLEGVCGNCILKNQCLGNCVADNYHQTHKLTAPYWFCQQAWDSDLFPATRLLKVNSQILKD